MADIQYLNYGDQQIEQQALLNNLANNVQQYVQNQSWSKKRKDKFMSAYLDIMNKGISGASNNSGMWKIDVNDTIDLDSMDQKDKEMYQEAAYFIQQQMSGLPTKSVEEKKKEDELPVFDNDTFNKGFLTQLSNDYFGGTKEIDTSVWNGYDKRGENGLRPRTHRAEMLINSLEKYAQNLENKNKYNFEKSPFGSLDEFKRRIASAREALINTPTDTDDDFKALNALGLKASYWFNDGSGDPSGQYIKLADGTQRQLSYAELDKYNQEQAKLKAEQEAEANKKKLAQQQANRFNYAVRSNIKMVGQNPQVLAQKYKNDQGILNQLSQYAQSENITPEQWSEILGAYRFYNSKGVLQNLSKQELDSFNGLRNYNGLGPGVLKKLPGVNGLYFDIRTGQVIKAGRREQQAQQPIQGLLEQNSPEALKEKQNKQSAINMNTPLSQMTEWTPEMKKEIEAIAWDAASILNPEAFSGSAMALYASHLRDEANPNRGTLEKWLDRGTAALGGIQGFGDLLVTGKLGYRLYQLGKSIGSVSKFAGILGAGFGAVGALEARDSIAKIANPDSLTPQDLENIAYGLMGLIGLKSFAKARNKQTIGKQANPTITEHNITIKDKNGKTHEVKVDEATAREINSSYGYGKKKADVDSKTFNHTKVKEAVQKYNEGKNPTEKLELEGASIQSSSKLGRVVGKDAVKSKQVKNPNAPEYVPVGTKWYSPFGYIAQGNNKWGYYLGGGWQRKAWENAAPEHSPKGLWQRAKEFWNPEPKIKNETLTSKSSTETPKTNSTGTNAKPKPPVLSKEDSKELQSTLRGKNFSNNEFKDESRVVGSVKGFGDLYGIRNSDGTHTLQIDFGGTRVNVTGTKADIKGKTLEVLRKDVMKKIDTQLPKENRSRIKFELIKQLKQNGYLKQGGTIDKNKIQQYKEFINK